MIQLKASDVYIAAKTVVKDKTVEHGAVMAETFNQTSNKAAQDITTSSETAWFILGRSSQAGGFRAVPMAVQEKGQHL